MKKASLIILTLVFMIFTCTQTAFAAKIPEVIFEKAEITDVKALWERASKGITDAPDAIINLEITLDENAPSNMIAEKKATTQVLRKVVREDGNIETFYATTYFTTLKDKSEDKDKKTPRNLLLASTSTDWPLLAASKSWDEFDGSYSIRHAGTFYYSSFRDTNSILWVRPERVDARWYRSDSQVSISSSRFGAQWLGFNLNGKWCSKSDFGNPLPISWGALYTRNINHEGYINCTAAGCYVVGEQRDTLTRGGYSWEFLSHYIFAENLNL